MFPSSPGGPQPLGQPNQPAFQPSAPNPLSQSQPMMPQSDPNALLAALLGGNDALGNNLIALFQMRAQNPNAYGVPASPYEPPQPPMPPGFPQQLPGIPAGMTQTSPQQTGPMSQMNGLPY